MNTNWIELICTIGPSSNNPYVLRRMKQLGVTLLRINMSHTSIPQLDKMVKSVRAITDIPICIDTEGAQIRTGNVINNSIELKQGTIVELTKKNIIGNFRRLTLTPDTIFAQIKIGTMFFLDFNKVLLLIIKKTESGDFLAKIMQGGKIGSNKAVNIDNGIDLQSITKKDIEAIQYANKNFINTFALSFSSGKESIKHLRSLVKKDAKVISKVESRKGINNLNDIIQYSDAILIDRGDLSREEPIEKIPALQKMIITKAHQKPIPVYVATNLLESMVANSFPTRAEINDIANTLTDGANGLVLAAETAVGKYPVQCVNMVDKMIKQYNSDIEDIAKLETSWKGVDLINNTILPHGYSSDDYRITPKQLKKKKDKQSILVNSFIISDINNIANGCYSPLTGFMTKEEIDCVLDNYSLPNGIIWPMPIILQISLGKPNIGIGETVILVDGNSNKRVGHITISDIYKFDKKNITKRWFKTDSMKHPGVKRIVNGGDYFIGGEIKQDDAYYKISPEYCMTPSQVRTIFAHKGWERVVGFHTRNIPHRAHEYIQRKAMEKADADGLFIHPAIGEKKSGDFTIDAIIESYKVYIDDAGLSNKALLSGFWANSWYSGPREAVFTAICRKNYGCSHFVIGRDHTGVGDFYKQNEIHDLFEKLGDIGIKPIFFNMVVYNSKKNVYDEISMEKISAKHKKVSGTKVRDLLTKRKFPPEWMVRPAVSDHLLKCISKGKNILVK